METAMEYFTRQRDQQLHMQKEPRFDIFSDEDILDKMCKASIDATLMSIAYSLAIMADSLKVVSESMEEDDQMLMREEQHEELYR